VIPHGIDMDHQSIDAGNVAERYVTGRLAPEEAAAFEEHYLDCPACCARVEAAERLQRGLRRLAEEAAVRAPGVPRWSRSPRWALAAAALLAVALLPAWIELREVQSLRSDLARTKVETGSADRLKGDLQQTRRDLAAEVEKREALARELAADRQPQASLPVVALTPVRGGEGPVRTLKLPEKPGWIALWVEPGDADFPAYRATLRKNEGAAVFEASRLTLNDLGALLITLHSTSLSPGSYRLEVDGLPANGAPVPAGRFALRVE
jgi:Putative zinc-finger